MKAYRESISIRQIKRVLLFLGIGTGVLLLFLNSPAGLSEKGMDSLGIATICVTLWVLTPIPLAATSLAAMVLLSSLNILEATVVFSFFGNSAVFFLLGVFIIAGAVMHTGLSKRFALFLMSRFDNKPRSYIMGILFTSSFLSLLMPEHAVAAMMFPVVVEISQSLKLEKGKSQFAMAMFLAMAWGAVAGGIGTFLGGARAPLAVELLHETFGREISFATWAVAAVPLALALTVAIYFVLIYSFKFEIKDVTPAKIILEQEIQRMGRMSKNEIKVGILLFATIFMWVYGGQNMNLATISLAAAVMVFVLKIASWLEVSDYINWGVIVMYGGAIALGKALAETSTIDWMAKQVITLAPFSPFIIILLLAALSKLITELISNVAAVVILVPFSFGFASSLGVSPEFLAVAMTIPAGLAFFLPVGTPPNAIAYASGYLSLKNVIKPGILLSIIAWIFFILVAKFYWPLILK